MDATVVFDEAYASQFKMLLLVFSDRNAVSLIEQDIGRLHQVTSVTGISTNGLLTETVR